MRNYRDLQVWSKAHNLIFELYRVSRSFPREKIYRVTSQLRRPSACPDFGFIEDRDFEHTTADLTEVEDAHIFPRECRSADRPAA